MSPFTSQHLLQLILINCNKSAKSDILNINPTWKSHNVDDKFYFEKYSISTTTEPDVAHNSTSIWLISSGALIALIIICVLCGICCCTQYRRWKEDKHREENNRKHKSEVYGDAAMDDTLYVDDETIQFNVVSDDENDTFRMNEVQFNVVKDSSNTLIVKQTSELKNVMVHTDSEQPQSDITIDKN
eukprot:107087_1